MFFIFLLVNKSCENITLSVALSPFVPAKDVNIQKSVMNKHFNFDYDLHLYIYIYFILVASKVHCNGAICQPVQEHGSLVYFQYYRSMAQRNKLYGFC